MDNPNNTCILYLTIYFRTFTEENRWTFDQHHQAMNYLVTWCLLTVSVGAVHGGIIGFGSSESGDLTEEHEGDAQDTTVSVTKSIEEAREEKDEVDEVTTVSSVSEWWINDGQYQLHCPPCDHRTAHGESGERSVETVGWAAATAILIFAFSNTIIVGATLTISYILYQVVITALSVVAPGAAAVFIKFASFFKILF